MLPETFAPGAEILPSLTVSVELAVGSQLPLLVTMVTFQVPSNGCWASAGVAVMAARVRTKTAVRTRFRRMNQILDVGDMGRLIRVKCDQSLPRRSIPDCSSGSKHLEVSLVPAQERFLVPAG
jgi:hypothetical protein